MSDVVVRIFNEDCLKQLPLFDADSIDSVVTDCPYGLEFMGKDWDKGIPGAHFWKEILRVVKPGGHMLAFGGTRTFHRLTCAIEDAGWEIRDCLMWVYGSGFPKSLNVGKAIDKAAGVEREVIGNKLGQPGYSLKHSGVGGVLSGRADGSLDNSEKECQVTVPATEAAKQWDGWGSALKPAWEPIILARKPLEGTVVENVLKYGTGALNIDGCRVGSDVITQHGRKEGYSQSMAGKNYAQDANSNPHEGRWPANFLHDGSDEVLVAFPDAPGQQGDLIGHNKKNRSLNGIFGEFGPKRDAIARGDSGSAARFFYCAKASRVERDLGCDALPVQHVTCGPDSDDADERTIQERLHGRKAKNFHPTVKPLALCQYLCRLITPSGGVVLDPFMGSGSIGMAAIREGFGFVGIELEKEYIQIAQARIGYALQEAMEKQNSKLIA